MGVSDVRVPRVFYGDPSEPVDSLVGSSDLERPNGPEKGDVLCARHERHYNWNGERWV